MLQMSSFPPWKTAHPFSNGTTPPSPSFFRKLLCGGSNEESNSEEGSEEESPRGSSRLHTGGKGGRGGRDCKTEAPEKTRDNGGFSCLQAVGE
uniref:Uncharacterized protein n=1 Tax=Chromera velia CCMP2878 TaxID=1169474 RepID=A0A0G4FH52_9ALVE|eukprot:Cvel_16991.t1-p1 / transcript=Cvel_16991.t1 / gene=Cvel_16991 / organism=Chromera_velia_CCMP2878 / gene_product=hypothetical protein / transcript_product=hypothetical protein / location=Cvel_scaffold1335:1871-3261(-) / protein_length=92 / sequence_SO=supercontig / SO=protein_coding / is_pseudo=false